MKMPNWCNNVAIISHTDKTQIDKIEEILSEDGEKLFNTLCPQPADIGEGWYTWNVQNWGTKWEMNLGHFTRQGDNTIEISFDTAWSPPVAFYEYIEREHDYVVEAYYEESGMAFCGQYIDGDDDYYEYGGMTAQQLEDDLPSAINYHFGVVDRKRDDEEQEYQEYIDSLEKTDWYPASIKPVRDGRYEVKSKSWGWPYITEWEDGKWITENTIDEWRGITQDQSMLIALKGLDEILDKFIDEENSNNG
jgi:hypothetical protein